MLLLALISDPALHNPTSEWPGAGQRSARVHYRREREREGQLSRAITAEVDDEH